MQCKAVVSILLAMSAGASGVTLADAPLTLAEAQRLAVARSRQLVAQDAVVTASREMGGAGGQLPDPTAKIEVQNLPVEGMDRWSFTRDFMTMRSVSVMQEWTRAEKRELRRERFERDADRALSEKDAAAATIERDTAIAWLDRYFAESMVDVAREQLSAVQLEIAAADSAYRAGRVNQSDVLGAHSARVSIEDRVSELELRAHHARLALARWTGASPDAPLAGKPAVDRIGGDAISLEERIAKHPQIAILARQEDVATTEARLARAEKKIDPTFEVMYSKRASVFGDMVSFGVSIPLPWNQRNRQDREIAAKLALAEAARAEREETARSLASELHNMREEWRNGLERVARYEREIIPLARERTRATLAAYQGGKAGAGELLLARRNETDARMQALQLESNAARLWAALTYLAPGSVTASGSMAPETAGSSTSMGSGSSMGPRSMGSSRPAPASPSSPASGGSTMTPSKM